MPTCKCCGQSIPIGQEFLTDDEKRRLPIGNQHDNDSTLIEWQCVKAAAMYYSVTDWTSRVDTSLTYEENIDLMAQFGTDLESRGGATLKDLAAEEKEKMRTR